MRKALLSAALLAAFATAAQAQDAGAKFAGSWRVTDDRESTFTVVITDAGGKISGQVFDRPITIGAANRNLLAIRWSDAGRNPGTSRANIRLDASGDRFTATVNYHPPPDRHYPDIEGRWTGVRQ
ncbi:MAG TPA: hypothetical protein VGG48_16460 [Rhizomicrobium sp.]|jgi:hypothetical protein